MAGKQTLKGEMEEELLGAVCIITGFAEDLGHIIDLLNSNETQDHQNDKIRNEVMSFMLQGLEAYNAKDYEGMQKYLHAAIQKLHSQEMIDFKDDKPRVDAKIKLAVARQKAIHNKEKLTKLLEKLSGVKNVS